MISAGVSCEVCVTHCEADDSTPSCRIWAQIDFDAYDKLVELMSEFEFIANSFPKPPSPGSIREDQLICAKYAVDENWYRASAVQVVDDFSVKCFFVDYGNSEIISLDNIVVPSDKYCSIPHLAKKFVACHLHPKSGKSWSSQELEEMNEQLINNMYTAQTIRVDGEGSVWAEFFHDSQPLESMLEAKGIGRVVKVANGVTVEDDLKFTPLELTEGSDPDVCISHVQADGIFYMQILENAQKLDRLMCQIEECSKSRLVDPSTGKACLVSCSDGLHYRAIIESMRGRCATVCHVDFGSTERVDVEDIFECTSSFAQLPMQAVKCQLHKAEDYVTLKMVSLLGQFNSKSPLVSKIIKVGNLHEVELIDHSGPEPSSLRSMLLADSSKPRKTSTGQLEEAVSMGKTFVPSAGVQANSSEDLYVTTILSPSKFFGQLVKFSPDELDAFQEKLQQFYTSGSPSILQTAAPGDFCCAQFIDDELFYRARVLETQGNKFLISFIDYGNEELKTAQDLFVLDQQFCNLPCQGIKCVMAGEISEDRLEAALLEKEITVQLLRNQRFHFDVCLPSCPKNSTFSDLCSRQASPPRAAPPKAASPPVQKQAQPSVAQAPTNPRIDACPMEAHTWLEVMVCHINDPCNFFCQPTSSADALTQLMDDIAVYVQSLPHPNLPFEPKLGSILLAQYSVDQGWYRVRISGVLSSGRYEVFFVDFGNHDTVPLCSLRPISAALCALPVQSFCCQMNGMLTNAVYAPQEVDDLWEFVSDKKLQILLLDWDTREERFNTEVFFKKGHINTIYGKKIGKLSPQTAQTSVLPPEPFVSGMRMTNGYQMPEQEKPTEIATDYKKLSLHKNKYADWQVSFSNHPGQFWCQLYENTEALDAMMDEIAGQYGSLGPHDRQVTNPAPGRACCAQYSLDEGWYRAIICSVNQGKAKVQFVDYGNDEVQPISSLKVLDPKFLELPQQSFEASLYGVEPVGGQWNDKAKEKFEELVMEKKLVGTVVSENKDGSYGVELCCQDELVHEILVKCHFAKDVAEGAEEIASPDRRLSISSTASSKSSASTARTDGLKSLSLKNGQYVDVSMAHSVDPSLFWIQLVEQTSRLQHLMNRLETVYTAPGAQDVDANELENHPVVCAKFSEDETWYRAQVMAVQDGKVHLQYVDYGNDEWLPLDQIKQIKRAFLELPAQALKCKLNGVEPREWTEDQLNSFEELTFEKTLLAVVHGGNSESGYAVELIDGKTNIGETLIKPKAAAPQMKPVEEKRPEAPQRQKSTEPPVQLPWEPFTMTDLDPSSLHSVMVSWVNSPASFYIQLADNGQQLEQMASELYDCYQAMKLNELALSSHQIGQSCVAYYQADGNWYRGKLLSSEGREAEVLYVDYGNVETVNISKVKQIKVEFNSQAAFAIECSLPGAEQVQWTNEKSKQFETLSACQLKCKVIEKKQDKYILDLISGQGESICDYIGLKRVEPAAAPKPASPPQKVPVSQAPVVPSLSCKINLNDGASHLVQISNVTDLKSFDCQLAEHLSTIDAFHESLEAFYSSDSAAVDTLSKGDVVVAKFSDELWYRAKILSVQSPTEATAKFLDYGNTDCIQKPFIKPLTSQFANDTIYSFECSLTGLPQSCTDAMIETFSDLAVGKVIKLVVKKSLGDKYEVSLQSDAGDVTSQLLQAHPQAAVQSSVPSTVQAPSATSDVPTCKLDLSVGSSHVIQISNVSSVLSFDCQLSEHLPVVDKFQEDFEAHYSGLTVADGGINGLEVGQIVAARFTDEFWYRAKILEVLSPDSASAKFLDYGNIDTIEKPFIKTLNPKFCETTLYSFECCLDGITSESPEMLQTFNDLALGQDINLTVTRIEGSKFLVRLKSSNGVDIAEKLIQEHPIPVAIEEAGDAQPVTGKINVYITSVTSPSKFYVQKESDSAVITEMEEKLFEHYDPLPHIEGDKFVAGDLCCARSEADGGWYRAQVQAIEGASFTVLFVDYGNEETMATSSMKKLRDEDKRQPFLATECHLKGCSAGKWTEDQIAALEGIAQSGEKCLQAEFHTESEISLFDNDENVGSTFVTSSVAEATTSVETSNEAAVFQPLIAPQGPVQVYVSHTDSPSQFYVQLVDNTAALDQLMADLETQGPTLQPLTQCKEGTACAAQFSEDNAWYRACILTVNGESAQVRYVDYGNSEETAISSLKSLPSSLRIPPLALQCTLKGEVDSSLTDRFLDLTVDKELTVICSTDKEPFTVDLSSEEDGDIASALAPTPTDSTPVEQEAAVTEPAESEPKPESPVTEEPTLEQTTDQHVVSNQTSLNDEDVIVEDIDISLGDLREGEKQHAATSHIISPSMFWCQLSEHETRLSTMQDQLHEWCESQTPPDQVSLGDLCAAKYSEDDGWYRARVILKQDERLIVHFVDYGNFDHATLAELRPLSADLAVLPWSALQCTLEGLAPLDGSSWSDEACSRFEEICVDKELLAELVRVDDEGAQVLLLLDMGYSLAQRLIDDGFAKEGTCPVAPQLEAAALTFSRWEETYDAENSVCEKETEPEDASDLAQQLDFAETEIKLEPDSQDEKEETALNENNNASMEDTLDVFDGRLSSTPMKIGDRLEVSASSVISPGDFWCQLTGESLSVLMDSMNAEEIYSETSLTNPTPGSACVAKFSQDQLWYRASLVSSTDDEFEVLFVDYGNVEKVDRVLPLRSEHAQLPCQAIHCALHGILPLTEEWDDASLARFEEVMDESKTFELSIKQIQDDCVVSELHEGEVDIGEQLVTGGYASKKEDTVSSSIEDNSAPSCDVEHDSVAKHSEDGSVSSPVEDDPSNNVGSDSVKDDSLTVDDSVEDGSPNNVEEDSVSSPLKDDSLIVEDSVSSPPKEDSTVSSPVTEDSMPSCVEELVTTIIQNAQAQVMEEEKLKAELGEKFEEFSDSAPKDSEESFAELSQCMDNSVGDLGNDEHISVSDDQSFSSLKYSEGEIVDLTVLSSSGTEEVICQPTQYNSQLSTLMEELDSVMAASDDELTDVQVGQPCSALMSDGRWMRARVEAVADTSFNVYAVDYGFNEDVPSVRLLPLKFLILPQLALSCSLKEASSVTDGSDYEASVLSQDNNLSLVISLSDKDVDSNNGDTNNNGE